MKTLEELRKEDGFDQFDDYMRELKNHDPASDRTLTKKPSASTTNTLLPGDNGAKE